MTGRPICLRAGLLAACFAICALAAGCAGIGGPALAPDAPGVMRAGGIPAPAAQALIAIGKSTKADVMAALGQAIVIPFDSGFEVWVYRWPGAQRTNRAATELVILFEPSGVVKKTSVRPGYGPEPRFTRATVLRQQWTECHGLIRRSVDAGLM